MLIKFLSFIANQNNICLAIALSLSSSCSHEHVYHEKQKDISGGQSNHHTNAGKQNTRCTRDGRIIHYEVGDLPCVKNVIKINSSENLRVHFKVVNEHSEDLYEHGYQELLRYKNGKVAEKLKLRRDDDAYWSETPFVRIRRQQYLADLRIFSLKDEIELWGEGRYQFEGDNNLKSGARKGT